MNAVRAYLDWNATAPLRSQAREAMLAAMEMVGNPSSVHAEGRSARALIESARSDVARLLGAEPSEVVFTSGGTEANNFALRGGWDCVLIAGIEHESVLAPSRVAGSSLVGLEVGSDGLVAPSSIDRILEARRRDAAKLLTLQLANNETGVIQPVADAASVAREHGTIVHSDAVQAVGRIPVDFRALGLDLMSVSAHKIGGPKGVGALVVREGLEIKPLLVGGGQELRRRAGTENVVAIAGFAAAARSAMAEMEQMLRLTRRRAEIEALVRENVPGGAIVGAGAPRLPNTVCFTWPGKSAETLVIRFDLAGVAVSSGAACASGKVGPSHVLAAMGYAEDVARSAVRISFGSATSDRAFEQFMGALRAIASSSARQPATVTSTAPGGPRSRLETIMGEA